MILFEGLKIGYTEEQVGRMKLKKWMKLSDMYHQYYNMSIRKDLFAERKKQESSLSF